MADENDDGQEKTEEPTGKRLSKARDEGQIARSSEINIAASVISVALFLFLFGNSLLAMSPTSLLKAWFRYPICA